MICWLCCATFFLDSPSHVIATVHSLGGNTKTCFVVTLSSSKLATEETLSTLQFADRAKRVVVHASVNETLEDAGQLR